jgi:hypothetical protein
VCVYVCVRVLVVSAVPVVLWIFMLGQTDYVVSVDGGKVAAVAAVRLFAATEGLVPLFVSERRAATRMCKGHSFLECEAVWSDRNLQTFGQKVLSPSGCWLLHPEDGRSIFLRESVYSARCHLENLQPGNSVSLCTYAACITRSMLCQ